MADLATTLNLMKLQQAPKVTKCYKSCEDLDIVASASNEFFYVRIPLSRLALSASSKKDGNTVVIDKNDLKIGRTASGFLPKVRIIKGHNIVMQAMAEDKTFINVWAGTKAIKKLSIMADDAISSNELQSKLNVLIQKVYRPVPSGNDPYSSGAWIREVYPFENYVIFDWKGDTWKQSFVVAPVTREVALSGRPVRVYSEYSEVPKGETTKEGAKAKVIQQIIESSAAVPIASPSNTAIQYYAKTFSQEQDFDTINSNDKPLGTVPGTGQWGEYTSYGAPSSEYANPPLRSMMNIEEALRLYLASIADGTHTPSLIPIFANSITASRYPNEVAECSIVIKESGANVNVTDFLRWQTKQLSASNKLKNDLSASSFAYIGDPEDISTWHCQCNSIKSIKQSLKDLKSSSFVPKSVRKEVIEKLLVQARKFSTNERSKLANKGIAEPDGSYPIKTKKDLGNAVKDYGRSSDKSSADLAHIRKRAKALGVKDPLQKNKKSIKGDGASNQLPGGYRPPPSSINSDAEIAQQMVAKKKCKKCGMKACTCGKSMKADMGSPMPVPGPGSPVSAKKKMSAGGPGSGRHPEADAAEKASTPEEHLKAAKYHGEKAQQYVQDDDQESQDLAFAHMKAQISHEDAARLQTERHTKWAQQASGQANAKQNDFDRSDRKVAASFQPNAGRKKFKVGDKVVTKHGKGRVSGVDKDTVEVTHTNGKAITLRHIEVKKAANKKMSAGGPGSGRRPEFNTKKVSQLAELHRNLATAHSNYANTYSDISRTSNKHTGIASDHEDVADIYRSAAIAYDKGDKAKGDDLAKTGWDNGSQAVDSSLNSSEPFDQDSSKLDFADRIYNGKK